MTHSAEEQARRLMVLFPGWVRSDRGEEAVGLVLDQLPPGTHRLPLRARLDLIRAGLHARRRWTPPLRVWVEATRADPRNRRGLVPEPWRPWLLHWVHDPRWRLRFTVSRMAAFVAVILFLWPAGLSGDESLLNSTVNLVVWVVVGTAVQHHRASRWRWAVSLRNGLVPWDLRPFPAEATQQGLIRPWLPNVAAVVATAGVTVGAVILVVVNLVVAVLVPQAELGSGGLSAAVVIFLAQAVILFAVLLPPVLRRISCAAPEATPPPAGDALVPPLQSGATRTISMLAAAFGIAVVCLLWAFAGTVGAVALTAIALGAGAQTAAVIRRQHEIGRTLGMWEVWPWTGPQPLLLVRADVLAAEGLGGPSARGSRLPEGMA